MRSTYFQTIRRGGMPIASLVGDEGRCSVSSTPARVKRTTVASAGKRERQGGQRQVGQHVAEPVKCPSIRASTTVEAGDRSAGESR